MHFACSKQSFGFILSLLIFCSIQNDITAQSSYETTVIGATEVETEFRGETPRLDEYVADPTIVHPVTKPPREGYHPKDDWPLHPKTNPNALPIGADPVWQQNYPASEPSNADSPQGSSFLPVGVNIEGLSETGFAPGDPSVDVGPNHVIQMTNGQSGAIMRIWDKAGAPLTDVIQYDTFFGFQEGAGDPIVLYDHAADRWLLTEFQSEGIGNALFLAVSTTADPLGTYYTYTVNTPNFPDYPHYSMWQVSPEQSMYLVTANESDCSFYVLDRVAMLNGDPAISQRFETPEFGFEFLAAAPVHWNGDTPPPVGQNPMAMRMKDDGWSGVTTDALEFWELEIDWLNIANSSLSLVQELPVSAFDSELCGYTNWACIPQPDGGQLLDPLLEVLMNRVQYRNFNSHESIVCCHATDVDGADRAGIRWYELRRTVGDWSVYQEGTYSPDDAGRFMGSIAMDDDGNIALGFNISSTTIYPSIRFTGRDVDNPLGQMTWGETTIQAGTAVHTSNRYGDYNQLVWDPASSSFWMTAMYNTNAWKTRVAQISGTALAIFGCTDPIACNYDSNADEDDGSCAFDVDVCGVCEGDDSSCTGCIDPEACNYDIEATIDDGSCDAGADVTVTIVTDDYPSETTWIVTDNDTGDEVAAGGPYGTQWFTETSTFCITEGCYTFTIYDAHGDGICCGYGPGAYTVAYASGSPIAAGGEFGASESTSFCYVSSTVCTDPIACNYDDPYSTECLYLDDCEVCGGDGIPGAWVKQGGDIDGEAEQNQSGRSVSLSSDGSIVAIGAQNDGNGEDSGHVRLYQWNGAAWSQLGEDIDGEAEGDWSGERVSLSDDGSIVAIGAHGNDGVNGTWSGHVRLYQWNGAAWSQLGEDIDGEAAFDHSGIVSLSADGSIVAIGAARNEGELPSIPFGNATGHVRLYQWDGAAWNQLGEDIDGEAAGDESGESVSLSSDGTIVAIGAFKNDGNGEDSGHVRLYQWNGAAWNQLGGDIDGEVAGDKSGYSVSLSADGTVVAIGAYANDGNGSWSGHVRLYQYNGSAWTQLGEDIDGEAEQNQSGRSVSLSSDGSIVAIGAQNDGNGYQSGHVRLYEWNGAAWNQLGEDIDGEAASDGSGHSVSLSAGGTTVAIGATHNDGNGTSSGHVRIYSWEDMGACDCAGTPPEAGYDCDGNCVSDADGDAICDEDEVPGCTDLAACNYNAVATDDNGSCWFPNPGMDCDGNCVDPGATEHAIEITTLGNGVEVSWDLLDAGGSSVASGGTSSSYLSFSYYAHAICLVDGSDYTMNCYDSFGDGWGILLGSGAGYEILCAEGTVIANNGGASPDNGVIGLWLPDWESSEEFTAGCFPSITGCTDPFSCNYMIAATEDDGSCIYTNECGECGSLDDGISCGCTYPLACNYDLTATQDNGSCIFAEDCETCDGSGGLDSNDLDQDGVCDEDEVPGCMDSGYLEFNPLATDEDGSCSTPIVEGCTYENAENYNASANIEDGTCTFETTTGSGCGSVECPDLDCDGIVSVSDILALLAGFGMDCNGN